VELVLPRLDVAVRRFIDISNQHVGKSAEHICCQRLVCHFSPAESGEKPRIFIRDFFALYTEQSCGNCGICHGKVVILDVECGSHDSPSVECYAPTSCPRDFGNQAVCAKLPEDAAYLSAFLFAILAR